MSVERRSPAVGNSSNKMGGTGELTNAPSSVQDLRRSLYVKAKAEATWRFWGLYVHVCKMETLREAYQMAKSNDGAPGIDGVTFEAIEESGEESFLTQIREELVSNTYRPMRARKKEIPKDGGVIDLDLRAYFDNVQHYLLLEKVARRVQDAAVMRLLKMILKATARRVFRKAG